MSKLAHEQRAQAVNCLIEGCAIRTTVRMTGIAKKTVVRLLCEVGEVCESYQKRVLRNLSCRPVQIDESWGSNYRKAKNVTQDIAAKVPDAGDVWLRVATDAETKLVPFWRVGDRDGETPIELVNDLASRLRNRVRITRDGHRVYFEVVESAFESEVDYAMLVKMYGTDPRDEEARYSPAKSVRTQLAVTSGRPDPKHISTSYVGRQNLSVRTSMGRYTRLSNGFSRKIENHAAAVALNYFAYNFIRIHRTSRMTPAMAAGGTDRLWDASDLVSLWESEEAKRAARPKVAHRPVVASFNATSCKPANLTAALARFYNCSRLQCHKNPAFSPREAPRQRGEKES